MEIEGRGYASDNGIDAGLQRYAILADGCRKRIGADLGSI